MSLHPIKSAPKAEKIQFIDLVAQQQKIQPQIEKAISRVLQHGAYIMGPEVTQIEQDLCDFTGAKYCVSCSSGTDALLMILMAQGIGPGDAVFLPSFTFPATPETVALLGAHPVLVDVDLDTFNLCPESLAKAYDAAVSKGLTPRAIMPVDLYGLPADYDAIRAFANDKDLWIFCDAAQGFGATYRGEKVGQIGLATATSFFPAKPLGCYGDGGAVFTDDTELYDRMVSIRVHGKGTDKYDNIRVGLNARLDTLQAAILIEKLKIFPQETVDRQRAADYYSTHLRDVVKVPEVPAGSTSIWAQYTICLKDADERRDLQAHLSDLGIPAVVYYPKPLHKQTAYRDYALAGQDFKNSDQLSQTVLSLPMHGYLDQETQDRVISGIISYFR